MKLLSFAIDGVPSWGALAHGGVVDLAQRTGLATLRAALQAQVLGNLPSHIENAQAEFSLDQISYLPVIPNPEKILCVGTNYHDHRIETGREVPKYPVIFARYANSQVGHGEALVAPLESDQFDYEGEIAVIIGRHGRRINESEAWEYVAGYAPYCDGTVRDWQHQTHQWTPGKTFPGSGAFGPWMATRDEVPDGADLSLVTRLNSLEVQRSSTSHLIFSIPKLIAYCSTFTELEPGDVIVTGTPGGVGAKRNPPLWMKPGDTLEVEVGGVGTLRCPVQKEVNR